MRQGATLVLALFLAAACGSRTDLWDVAGSGNNPVGGGGKGGAGGSGFVGGTGGSGIGVGGATGKGGSGTGGATTGTGTGGATTGSGGSTGTGGIGGGTTGSGGATTGSGGSGTGGSGTGGATAGSGGSTGGSGGTGGSTGGTGGTGRGGTGGAAGTGGGAPDGGSACFNIIRADEAPFDLHYLIDKSPAMTKVDPPSTTPRWNRLSAAIEKTGFSTGLNFRYAASFYPLLSDASPDPACSPGEHLIPAIEYAWPRKMEFPDTMAAQMLAGSPSAWPALQGATDHAAAWFAQPKTGQNPREEAVVAPSVVLLAGSQPLDCGSTVLAMATTAKTAFDGPFRIRTFVVAIGSDASGYEPLAAAGGTSRVLYSPPLSLEEALVRVHRSRILCDIPIAGALGPSSDKLQVRMRLENGRPLTPLPRRINQSDCANGGGWFLADPKLAMICPDTCAEIIDAPAGQVGAGFACDADAGTTPIP